MSYEVVIFDTETTGLISNHDLPVERQPKIIEFYGCRLKKVMEEWKLVGEFEALINPEERLDPKITQITTITDEQLKGKPTAVQVWKDICKLFDGADEVVAHNLAFDKSIVEFENKRCSFNEFPWPGITTCTVEATLHLEGRRLSLGALHELLFGEKFVGAHRARVDVEALARCYIRLHEMREV